MTTKNIFLILVGFLIIFSDTNALAQSSVTLYGSLDDGIEFNSNSGGHHRIYIASNHEPKFVGIQGVEDLGGGWSTFFKYSNQISLNTGSFSPQLSYVGLKDSKWGSLTLGRQFDIVADLVPETSERYNSVTGVHVGNYDRTTGDYVNNLVLYRTPIFQGFQFSTLYSFGSEVTGYTNGGRAIGAELSYATSSVKILALYQKTADVPGTPYSDLGVNTLFGIDFSKAPTRLVNMSQDVAAVGAHYDFNGWRVVLSYANVNLSSNNNNASMQTYDGGFYKYITPAFRAGMGYEYSKLNEYHWNEVHAHLDYFLSKRTDVYLRVLAQVAAQGQHAVMYLEAPSSTNKQVVVGTGLTHHF
ncbi:porin [Caballeronia sp. DA-9]|uniref:porin n=1 Tax=Caballeronia sp. DA-9 TaxID=3436237 RepID=UPI003F6686CB